METLRRFVPLAPVPGAVLTCIGYGLNSSYVVIAGWWLVLVGLVLLESNQVTRWMALIAGASFVPGAKEAALFAIAFVTTALLSLIATTTHLLRYGLRGRIAGATVLTAIGAGALLSFGFPDSPYLDNPATQLWAALVLTPAGVAFGVLWRRLDRPPSPRLAEIGSPASFLRRFLAGLVGWVTMGIAVGGLGNAEAGPIAAVSYPVCVLLLQVFPTARWGRTLGQLSTGLRVVRVDTGEAPGWLRSFVRFAVFQAVPLLGLIYFIAWATQSRMGYGRGLPERLAWDRASGTAVLRVSRTQAVKAPAKT